MTFSIHDAFTVQDSDDVNDNMYHIAQGSRMPMSQTAQGSLASSDNTASLGDSTTTWNTLYANNVYPDTVSSNDNLLIFIGETTLSTTATSISFTNLNGDDYRFILALMYFVAQTNLSSEIRAYFNDTGTGDYSYGAMYGRNAVANIESQRNLGYMEVCKTQAGNSKKTVGFAKHLFYTKTGRGRSSVGLFNRGKNGTEVDTIESISNLWANNSTTVTSLNFYEPTQSFEPGTSIKLWGKK